MLKSRLSKAMMPVALTCVGAVGLGATALLWQPRSVSAQANTDMYVKTVQPILANNCYKCHGGENHRGGLNMNTRAGFLKGGHDGAVIVPGHPEQSLLVKLILSILSQPLSGPEKLPNPSTLSNPQPRA